MRKADLIKLIKNFDDSKSAKEQAEELAARVNVYRVTLNLKYRPIEDVDLTYKQTKEFLALIKKEGGFITHVKKQPIKSFIEWLFFYDYNTVISAKWVPNKFVVQVTVKSSRTIPQLTDDIKDAVHNEHTHSNDNGWVVAVNHNVVGLTDIDKLSIVKVK